MPVDAPADDSSVKITGVPRAGGNDNDERFAFAERVTTLNLRRLWWFLATCLALELIVCALRLALPELQHPALATLLAADVAATLASLVFTSWIRRRPPPLRWRQLFVGAMLCAMLGVMDYYFFGLLKPLGVTSLYVVGVMCAGVLFLIPPPIFTTILVGHHLIFSALLLRSDLGGMQRLLALVDGSVGVTISLLAAWLIYTARRRDFHHERTLAASNAALHERNAELNDLMAIAAHDLRSPLQGVQHLVDLAAQNPAMPPEHRQRALDEVRRTCRNLLRLIGRLLEAHNAELAPAGRRAIDADLMPVIAEAVRRAQPLAAPRGVRCELRSFSCATAVAHHDPSSLLQALDNLVGNAVKFAPENGTVTIDVRAAGDRWRIAVEDNGPGIPPDERARLFQKFFRGSVRASGGEPSSGLGLFIVRKEVEAMGGLVHYEPRAPHGSVFVITLRGVDSR